MDINQIMEQKCKDAQPDQLYKITKCWNCPNAVVDITKAEAELERYFRDTRFSDKQRERLAGAEPKHHDIFHVAIAGCPNSCCQPQIKDFSLQAQAVPEVGEGCTGCGLCMATCPDQAIVLNEKGPVINRLLCLNCGICARSCLSETIRVGLRGYRVIRGGKLGRKPRLAQEICSLSEEDGVLLLLEETVDLLHREGKPGERLGALLERLQIV